MPGAGGCLYIRTQHVGRALHLLSGAGAGRRMPKVYRLDYPCRNTRAKCVPLWYNGLIGGVFCMHCFEYGEDAVRHLKRRDRRLGEAIDVIGPIRREVRPDLFAALVHSIVGQQISMKAQETVWRRIEEELGAVTPEAVAACSIEKLKSFGISFRKAQYIRDAAERVLDGRLNIAALYGMSDDEVYAELVRLSGVGVWTAEMLMLFSMQRPDILSYGDLAIQRGMRMLYRHREITRPLFEKYRRRYSPYGSVASLYLWAIAGGAIEGLTDPAAKKTKR